MPGEDKKSDGTQDGGASDGKGTVRKIAGKYNSVEEAVESMSKASDKNYHETREEIGAIRQLLERALTPVGTRGNVDDDDQGYSRGRRSHREEDEEEDIDPSEFLSNPGKSLRKRDEKLFKRITESTGRHNAAMINNAATVLAFQMKNPDLEEHEVLVQGFLKDTDPRDSLAKRLKEAGKQTRAYLAKFKKKDDEGENDENEAGRSPNKDEYVEDSAKGGKGRGESTDEENENENDDSLAAHVSERKAWKAKRFQTPVRGSN